MWSKIKRFASNLPGVKQLIARKKRKTLEFSIKTVDEIRTQILTSAYEDKEYVVLDEVLKKTPPRKEVFHNLNRLIYIPFYSRSTTAALNFIYYKHYSTQEISYREGVKLTIEEKPFNCWYSGDEHTGIFFNVFQSSIKDLAEIEIQRRRKLKTQTTNTYDNRFFESMLFRLLLTDFLALTKVNLELQYEKEFGCN